MHPPGCCKTGANVDIHKYLLGGLLYFCGVFVGLFLLFWEAEEKQVLNDKSQTDSCSAGGSSAGLSELSHSLRSVLGPRRPRVTSSQLVWWLPVLLWPLCSPVPRVGACLGMLSRLGRGLRNPPAQQPPSSLCRRDLALRDLPFPVSAPAVNVPDIQVRCVLSKWQSPGNPNTTFLPRFVG